MLPPANPGQSQAAPGGAALTLAAGSADPDPDGVVLNPLGEWVLVAAWAALLAVNLWTWRLLLKPRDRRPERS